MKTKIIGFPIKDGCHVEGSDLGIDVIKNKTKLDKVINIDLRETDLETIIVNDLKLAKEVDKTQKENMIPVSIGGDHSLAIGSIAGSAANLYLFSISRIFD